MHTHSQTDRWVYWTAAILGLILMTSLLGFMVLLLAKHFISEPLFLLGFMAGTGLAMLLISPISHEPIG